MHFFQVVAVDRHQRSEFVYRYVLHEKLAHFPSWHLVNLPPQGDDALLLLEKKVLVGIGAVLFQHRIQTVHLVDLTSQSVDVVLQYRLAR